MVPAGPAHRCGGSPATNVVSAPTTPSFAAPPGEPSGSSRPGSGSAENRAWSRAHRLARPAVHALIRVDVKHPLTLVDAIHRALLHARPVQHVHARLADHVSHPVPFPGGMLLLEF